MLQKGTQFLTEWLTDIGKKVVDWFVKQKAILKKLLRLTTEETEADIQYRLIKDFVLDEAGRAILTVKQIKQLRVFLKKIGVNLVVVEEHNPQTRALWRKMALGEDLAPGYYNGAYAMFVPATSFSKKYQQTLNTGLYILDKITPYTVAHELNHVKLWHKMNIAMPELAEQYAKISNRVHEEYVLAELLKDGKWAEAELMSDLNIINSKRDAEGLIEVTLDYFKNWKLVDNL